MNIDQEFFIDYLTRKAVQCGIPHDPDNKQKAFHIIDNPYDLGEFDQALRNFAAFPAVLMEEGEGEITDNDNAKYYDNKEFQLMIVDKRNGEELPRTVRNRCLQIAKDILVAVRKDRRANDIIPGTFVNFQINTTYVPIGPMGVGNSFYGYMITLRFTRPFTF